MRTKGHYLYGKDPLDAKDGAPAKDKGKQSATPTGGKGKQNATPSDKRQERRSEVPETASERSSRRSSSAQSSDSDGVSGSGQEDSGQEDSGQGDSGQGDFDLEHLDGQVALKYSDEKEDDEVELKKEDEEEKLKTMARDLISWIHKVNWEVVGEDWSAEFVDTRRQMAVVEEMLGDEGKRHEMSDKGWEALLKTQEKWKLTLEVVAEKTKLATNYQEGAIMGMNTRVELMKRRWEEVNETLEQVDKLKKMAEEEIQAKKKRKVEGKKKEENQPLRQRSEESDDGDWTLRPMSDSEDSRKEKNVAIMKGATAKLHPKAREVVTYMAEYWKDMTAEDWETYDNYKEAMRKRKAMALPERKEKKLFGTIRAAWKEMGVFDEGGKMVVLEVEDYCG